MLIYITYLKKYILWVNNKIISSNLDKNSLDKINELISKIDWKYDEGELASLPNLYLSNDWQHIWFYIDGSIIKDNKEIYKFDRVLGLYSVWNKINIVWIKNWKLYLVSYVCNKLTGQWQIYKIKDYLNKTEKWKLYMQKIDIIIQKLTKTKLQNIYNRLLKAIDKVNNTPKLKNNKLLINILEYLKYKIVEEIK